MDANNVVLLLNELEDPGYVGAPARPLRSPAPHRRDHPRRLRGARTRRASPRKTIEDDILRALDAAERATLWNLLTRALYSVEPGAAEPACLDAAPAVSSAAPTAGAHAASISA